MPHDDTTPLDLLVAGIYVICNKRDGAVYVGSSVNVYHRWSDHHHRPVLGKHTNVPLQQAWQRDGAAAFTWLIVERDIPGAALSGAEQRWLDQYRQVVGQQIYNSRQRLDRQSTHQENKGVIITRCPTRLTGGKRQFREGPHPRARRDGVGRKLTEADVRAIRASDGPSTALGERYGVTPVTISHVRNGKTWQHIPFAEGTVPRTWDTLQQERRERDKRQMAFLISAEARRLLAALVTERGVSQSEVIESLIREAAQHHQALPGMTVTKVTDTSRT